MQTPDEPIVRGHTHKKKRAFYYRPREGAVQRYARRGLIVFFVLCLVYSGVQLAGYAGEYLASRRASQELRALYYEEKPSATAAPEATARPVVPVAASTPNVVRQMPTAAPSAPAKATASAWLEQIKYPENPYLIVSSRFEKLRRQNSDIIGWLNIADALDEAVVQRDNEYYLRRDYRGYHNDNGAVFLEETCDLRTRPYTLMLYAHNMKTGAMFGMLRNYEDVGFYRKSPFITFNTIYEDGRYVIFSVATVSLDRQDHHYYDFSALNARSIAKRKEMILLLKIRSLYQVDLDVAPDDQLLLLITCVGDDDERRVIAARRIRPDESEQSLQNIVRTARKW